MWQMNFCVAKTLIDAEPEGLPDLLRLLVNLRQIPPYLGAREEQFENNDLNFRHVLFL